MPAQYQTLEKDQLGGRGIAGWNWLGFTQMAIFRVGFHVAEMEVDIRWMTRWHEPRQAHIN